MAWNLQQNASALRPAWPGAMVRGWWPVLACLCFAVLMQMGVKPLLSDTLEWEFGTKMILDIGINIVLAVSLTMVNGFTGQFSIGHAAFMAVGGYAAAGIMYYGSIRLYGTPEMAGGLMSSMLSGREGAWLTGADLMFFVAILCGGVVAAGCGYLVGLPSLRLRGDYLAIVTLGFGEIVRVLIQSQTTEALADGAPVTEDHLNTITVWNGVVTTDDYITPELIQQVPGWVYPKYLGGSLGFSNLPPYASLFWVYLLVGITLLVALRIKRSSYGRALLSIREDEIASEAMGVDTTRYKIRAFVLSAFFAGCAGALFAHTIGVQLNAGELGFVKSFDIIIMVVLGGLGSISGSTLAAILLTILPELLREPKQLATVRWWAMGVLAAGVAVVFTSATGTKRRGVGMFISVVAGIGLVLGWAAWSASKLGVELSNYRMLIYAASLVLMMILRPQGLLGVKELWDLWKRRSVS